jgi:PST family polysaccharide transporter
MASEFKSKIVRGASLLAFRQAISAVIAAAGALVTVRLLGPTQYGVFATAAGFHGFVVAIIQTGIGVYLIRGLHEADDRAFDVASTLLFVLACIAAILEVAVFRYAGGMAGLGPAIPVLVLLACILPIQLSATPAVARLERRLNYGRIAAIDLAAQTSAVLVSTTLAIKGSGAWAPAVGLAVQQVVSFVLYHLGARWFPRIAWEWSTVKAIVQYATGFSASMLIWNAKGLVNSFVVGGLLGVDAVGYVNVAIRLVDVLAVVKNSAWRLAIVALSRVKEDVPALIRAVNQGMELQVLALGIPLILFSLSGETVFVTAFGQRWLPALTLFPYIAVGMLANVMFALHASALYLFGRNWAMVCFHTAYMLMFAGAAAILAHLYGYIGYGYAELIVIPTYIVLHFFFESLIGPPSYGPAIVWFVPFSCALLLRPLGWWTAAIALLPLFSFRERSRLGEYFRLIKGSRSIAMGY